MAFKKAADDVSYRVFRKELENGTLGNLYIFHGEETYLRDFYLGELKKQLLTGGLDDFNYHVLSGKELTIQRLHEAVDAMPMMSERTFVVVNDYELGKGDQESLAQLLDDLPDYVCLVFVYDTMEYKLDSRTKLAKVVKEKGRAVDFVRQDQKDLTGWIARRFRALGHEIGVGDAQYLIFLCGDLMTNLISEIGKIGAYAKEKRVTRQDIDAVATPQLDAVIFNLTDAVAAGDFDKAFSVLSELLHMQEQPIPLLAGLGRNLRQLYAARLVVERKKSVTDLMELCGIRSAYPAEKLMRAARRFSLDWCRRAVIRCEEADLAMKSTGADGRDILVGLLLELSAKKSA